jgi:hypothetical protein
MARAYYRGYCEGGYPGEWKGESVERNALLVELEPLLSTVAIRAPLPPSLAREGRLESQ